MAEIREGIPDGSDFQTVADFWTWPVPSSSLQITVQRWKIRRYMSYKLEELLREQTLGAVLGNTLPSG